MSGGLDANALAKPKGLSVRARRARGGSLSVIATALIETESRMDDVIFESSRDRQSELRLSARAGDRRLYPAVDIAASGTRREELLADPPTVAAKQTAPRGLVGLPPERRSMSCWRSCGVPRQRRAARRRSCRQFPPPTMRLYAVRVPAGSLGVFATASPR